MLNIYPAETSSDIILTNVELIRNRKMMPNVITILSAIYLVGSTAVFGLPSKSLTSPFESQSDFPFWVAPEAYV